MCGGLVRTVLCAVAWYVLYSRHALAINRYLLSSQRRFGVTPSVRKHDWNGDRMKLHVFSLSNTEFSFVRLTIIGSLCWSHMTFYAQVLKKSVLWPGDSYKKYSNRYVIRKISLLFFLLSCLSNCLVPFLFMYSGSLFLFSYVSLFLCLILMRLIPFFLFFSSSFSLSFFSLPKSLLLFLLLTLFIFICLYYFCLCSRSLHCSESQFQAQIS